MKGLIIIRKISIILTAICIAFALSMGALASSANQAVRPRNKTETTETTGNRSDKKYFKKMGKHLRADAVKIAARLLNKSVDEIKQAFKNGVIGELLKNAGKLEKFKKEYIAEIKLEFDKAVAENKMIREQADINYAELKRKIEAYDGTNHFHPNNGEE